MRIRTLAERTKVPAKTIRYYEEIGLLPPARRLPNGYRDYDEADVERLQFVAGARSLGLSLAEIRELLDLRDQGVAPCRTALRQLREKADEIERRIADLQRLETELRHLYALGLTFPLDDVDGKDCVCHLIRQQAPAD